MMVNQNLLELRNAILAVAEAHADLAVSVALEEDGYDQSFKFKVLNDATHQLDEALEFLGGA